MSENIKAFLYSWCCKKKITPEYEFKAAGSKQRQRFICECRLPGYDYTSVGNSTSKKDAQANSAKDMVQYLVRLGEVNPVEVPAGQMDTAGGSEASMLPHSGEDMIDGGGYGAVLPGGVAPPHLSLGLTGNSSGSLLNQGGHQRQTVPYQRGPPQDYMEAVTNKRLIEEAEEADFTADLHGNWTLENAKGRLHQFIQMHHIKTDYKYSMVGPDHNRLDLADEDVYI